MQISGSSAVVVGGTGGMGEATVRRLHAAGGHVVVADVNDEKGKALVDELGVHYLHTDAGSENDVAAAFAEAASLGPVRISVDVHGGPAAGGRLLNKEGEPLKLEDFRLTLESYLISQFNVTRACRRGDQQVRALQRGRPAGRHHPGRVPSPAYEGQIGQVPLRRGQGGHHRHDPHRRP